MRRFSILAAGLLVAEPTAQAQQPAKTLPTIAELTKNKDTISQGDEESTGDLAAQTARQLVTYPRVHALSKADQADLSLVETVGPSDVAPKSQ